MKAILIPFSPDDSGCAHPGIQRVEWAVVASPDDLARAAPGTSIDVTSDRTCAPATNGEALRRHIWVCPM